MMFKSVELVFALVAILNLSTEISSIDYYSVSDEVSNSIYFSLNSYQTLFDENINLAFSPFSIRVAYNTLYQCVVAFGRAEFKIKPILFEDSSIPYKGIVLSGQRDNLLSTMHSRYAKVVNKLLFRNYDGLQLSYEFRAASTIFLSEYEHVDFTQNATIVDINNWAANRTSGHIPDLVDSSIITPDSNLLFVNTLFFKAQWLKPFDWNDRIGLEFNSIDGTKKIIDFISVQTRYKFAFLNQFKFDVLELPYERQSGYVLWILLPHTDSNIAELKSLLTRSLFTTIKNNLVQRYRSIKLPLFEIESELDGTAIAPEVFAYPNFEVFDDLISAVDKIQQKVKFIVNLDGTEAVPRATNWSIVPVPAMFGPKAKEFVADRPFMYTVLHKITLQPILIGHFAIA